MHVPFVQGVSGVDNCSSICFLRIWNPWPEVFFSFHVVEFITLDFAPRPTSWYHKPRSSFSSERYSTQEVAVRIATIGSIWLPRTSHVAGQTGNPKVGKFCWYIQQSYWIIRWGDRVAGHVPNSIVRRKEAMFSNVQSAAWKWNRWIVRIAFWRYASVLAHRVGPCMQGQSILFWSTPLLGIEWTLSSELVLGTEALTHPLKYTHVSAKRYLNPIVTDVCWVRLYWKFEIWRGGGRRGGCRKSVHAPVVDPA